jgi:hypothetical protein
LHAGRIAQSVEQRIENPRVAGSIPAPATKFRKAVESRFAKFKLGDFTNGRQFKKLTEM